MSFLSPPSVFMQEWKPQMSQMPVHSAPKGLDSKAELFRGGLQKLDEDITFFSTKVNTPNKVQLESAMSK